MLNYCSLFDVVRLFGVDFILYWYNDMDYLVWVLCCIEGCCWIIVVDVVFSMEGIVVDLVIIVEFVYWYGCWVYVDEFYVLGVFGFDG